LDQLYKTTKTCSLLYLFFIIFKGEQEVGSLWPIVLHSYLGYFAYICYILNFCSTNKDQKKTIQRVW